MRKRTFTELFNERPSADELNEMPRFPVIGILDNIRSMHNVGSMFRTADGARINSLFLTGYTSIPPRKEIDKTALGATETVPWQHFRTGLEAAERARKDGYQIWVLEQTTNSADVFSQPVEQPVALVVGNEVWGVSDDIVSIADKAIEIPMFGLKQSLNVSVAFGLAVYSVLNNMDKNLFIAGP